MQLIIFQILLLVGIAICQTQKPFVFSSFGGPSSSVVNSGRYQPALRTTTYRPYRPYQPSIFGNVATSNKRVDNSGRYNPANDAGRYKPVNDGRFRPQNDAGRYKAQSDAGRYKAQSDAGRYKAQSDAGRYQQSNVKYQANPNDGKYKYTDEFGRYKDSGHGKYINGKYVDGPYVDGKYVGDNSGYYSHDDNGYQHQDVGGGEYKGQNVPYDPYKDKQYPGGAYKGDKSGSGYQGSQTPSQGVKVESNAGAYRTVSTSPVVGLPAVDPKYVDSAGYSTLGVPQGLEKSSAAGLYEKYNYGIVVDDKEISPKGDYHYRYQTENKIYGEEVSKVVSDEEEHKTGYYKYTGPDSNVYVVTYKAGVEGFVPEAKHLPTEPPIPELILKSLEVKRQRGLL